jgi:hypothetical protein
MTQKIINLGTAANKGDGDVLRVAFGKVNDNFTELYAAMGADVQIPNQATHGGKYLTTNGATLSWATVATGTTLPSQSGNEGKFLRTDSSTLSWVAITMPQDTGDLTNNEGFITEASELVNGANTVGLDSQGNLLFTNGEQVKTNFLGGGLELYHSSDNSIGIYDGYARINTFTTGGAKHTWEFDDDGKLTVPGNIARSDPAGLTIGANYNVYIVADQTDNDVTWTFDGSSGSLTLPNLGTITNPSGGGAPTGTIYTFNTDYTSGSPTLSAAEYIDLAAGGDADNVETSWVITFANGTTKTVTSRVLTSTPDRQRISWTGELTIFLIADVWPLTIQSADYNAGGTASLELSPDGTTTWTFGTDGSLTFPDTLSIKDSVIGKASTNTITEGEASQTTAIESQIEITTTGVVIAKRTSVTVNDGVITTVNDSGSTLELDNTHASITYYIEPDGPDNNSLIQFTTDSSAGGGATIETVTEDVGGTAHGRVRAAGNSVQVSAKTFLGTNKTWSFTGAGDLQLPESGNILSNGANYIDLANFETSYNDAEGAYQDALTAWMTLETFRPVWFALPGRLAYDEMIAWTPTTGQPALPLNLPPVAKNAQDSYAAWQETIALSKLTVASDIAEFDFNSTGKLRLPQGGTVGGGDQADIDAAYDDWQADEAAWQYLITTGGADFNVRPWNFAGPSRAEKQAIVLSMWQAQQSGAAIDWVPISSAFYNEARAWLAVTANQDGYDEWKKLTTSVNITSDDKTWAFTNDGRTTFPNGVVPEHSYGAAGDKEGMVIFDDTYIYYCTADYVNNTTDIWKRTAHGAGTW